MKWLRAKLRAWLGITDETVSDEATPIKIAPSLFNEMLVKAGENFVVNRKVGPPALPPMVRGEFKYDANNDPGKLGPPEMAFDDAANAPMWAYLNQTNCGLGFPGYSYLAELAQRSEYRSPSETLASEITREWIELTVKGKGKAQRQEEETADEGANDARIVTDEGEGEDADDDGDIDGGLEDKVEKLEAALEEFKVRDHFRRIAEQDGFFGRSQLFIDIDPGSKDADEVNQLPLVVDPETIKKGTLRGFKVVEPIWTTPYAYNATDPTKPDFYKPRAWFVIGRRVHASRLLTFVSREVPDMLKPAYNFGGLSMSQLMEPYVFRWLRTSNSVSNLIHNFSVMILKTDMNAVLQGGSGQGLLDRAKLFTQTRDNQGLTLIDKTREEMQEVHASLASLDKLQAQSQEHMAAPSHMPLVKLTGITPAGLNADSEGEIQVWYDFCRAFQIFFYGPHLKHVLDILQLHLFGEIDEAIGFQWVPLASPTVKELSEIRKANAETDAQYVQMGAVSADEVREKVAADPESGYNNLSGAAPGPPELGMMEAEHEFGQEGAEAEHERARQVAAEEAKRAGKNATIEHGREVQKLKLQAKLKPKPKAPKR